jgi:hypothetical protein
MQAEGQEVFYKTFLFLGMSAEPLDKFYWNFDIENFMNSFIFISTYTDDH